MKTIMTTSMASANHQHRGHQSSPCPISSARSIHSQVHDVVSVTYERFNDVVSSMQSKHGVELSPSSTRVNLVGLRDGLDAIVKVMFAPCVSMDVGGVPREEMPPMEARTSVRAMTTTGAGRGAASFGTSVTPPWGASIPFEVSASSNQDTSLVHSQSTLHDLTPHGFFPSSTPSSSQRPPQPPTARERLMAESHIRLRQLGARHQLAGGFSGESLADTAAPLSPADDAREEILWRDPSSPDQLVDFDDGISAISSHTLEEMERKRSVKEKGSGRTGLMMRVNPHDFTQVVEEGCERGGGAVQGGGGEGWRRWGGGRLDLVEEVDEKNTEVVFGEPFYEEKKEDGTPRKVIDLHNKTNVNRVASNQTNLTMNSTYTEDSHEFEELHRRHEAMYWQDQDRVADSEHRSRGLTQNHGRDAARSRQRMSIEERARRLREISRSRSRSDGTSSSCVSSNSGTSLASGSHPHDTLPIHASDIFRKSSYGSGGGSISSGSGRVGRRNNPPKHPQSRLLNTLGVHTHGTPSNRGPRSAQSDPFESLDHDEI